MVSIIVFSFDGKEQLARCIETVRSVTAGDHEILEAPSQSPGAEPSPCRKP